MISRYIQIGGLALLTLAFLPPPFIQAEEKIKIGVPLPLSGGAATYGRDIQKVILFANDRLGNSRYNLIFEDDRCSGRDAVSIAQRLVNVEKVKYVLGIPCSGALLPSAGIYDKAGIVVISPAASAASVSNAGENIFRTWLSDRYTARVLYEYVTTHHKSATRFGIMSEQTETHQELLGNFKSFNSSGHLQIFNENFLPEDTDFRSALHKAIESGERASDFLRGGRFNGIIGEWWFDENGDIQGLTPVMKVVRSGKGVTL